MFPDRIPDELVVMASRITRQASSGFLIIPVVVASCSPQSTLQGIYQHIHEQAVAIVQKRQIADMFVIMN
jgi:hypothetical protein